MDITLFAHAGHEHATTADSVNLIVYAMGLGIFLLIATLAIVTRRHERRSKRIKKHEKKT
jgi:cytochrome c biogenesis protein CcdA